MACRILPDDRSPGSTTPRPGRSVETELLADDHGWVTLTGTETWEDHAYRMWEWDEGTGGSATCVNGVGSTFFQPVAEILNTYRLTLVT
jgi:hypothetical protein